MNLIELDAAGRERLIPELRAQRTPLTNQRLQCLACKGGDQVGLLLFDLYRCTQGILILSEIWVVEERRGQSIGLDLIKKSETIAAARGCNWVQVRPVSLSRMTNANLIEWYKKQGFSESTEPEVLQKNVGGAPPHS